MVGRQLKQRNNVKTLQQQQISHSLIDVNIVESIEHSKTSVMVILRFQSAPRQIFV